MSLKKWVLPVLLVAMMAFGGMYGVKGASAAELSKEQLDAAIHDYIVNHADVILKAVDDYQRKDSERRQSDALKLNHEELFNNEKSPFIGNPTGDVTLIEFFDYNCHYCKQIFPELKAMADKDKKLKIIFKDFPILGPTSEVSAKWALAAQAQGKYFEFHQKMMENKGPISDDLIAGVAKSIGLDLAKARHDVDGTDVLIQIERNRDLAAQMNFTGTPSFVINKEAFSGVPDKKELEDRITAARDGKDDAADDKKDDKPGESKEE